MHIDFSTIVAFVTLTLPAHGLVIERQASTNAPDYTNTAFINNALSRVNGYRAARNATAYTWNQSLAAYSFNQSQKCQMQHSGGPYGENIYWTYSSAPINFTKATLDAVDAWMSEEPLYKVDNPYQALHFTALVWKNSKRMGCAWTKSQCPTTNGGRGGYYFFCEYDPMGNIIQYDSKGNIVGQFAQNVQTLPK